MEQNKQNTRTEKRAQRCGGPNPDKVGPRVEAPKGGGPKGGARKCECPNFSFFLTLWGLLVELLPGFQAVDHPKSALGLPEIIV